MFQRILVPWDGSQLAERAFAIASDLADAYDAEITAVCVLERSRSGEGLVAAPRHRHGAHAGDPATSAELVQALFAQRHAKGQAERIERRHGGVEDQRGRIEGRHGGVENQRGRIEGRHGGVEDQPGRIEGRPQGVENQPERFEVELEVIEGHDVVADLLDFAHEHGFDLIVIGHHHSSRPEHLFPHGLTERLMFAAQLPVLVVAG